jgi:hypothetical protein
MTLLLATLPAAESFASEPVGIEGTCSTCHCCIQPRSNNGPQNPPVSAPSRTLSVERFATETEPALTAPVLPQTEMALHGASLPVRSYPDRPLFERFCSLLI